MVEKVFLSFLALIGLMVYLAVSSQAEQVDLFSDECAKAGGETLTIRLRGPDQSVCFTPGAIIKIEAE